MPELQALISTYGWIGVIIWLLAERALPLFREWVVPESKRRATREQAEHERINKLEERQVKAVEQVAQAFQQLSVTTALMDSRLARIESSESQITAGVGLLLERSPVAPRRSAEKKS